MRSTKAQPAQVERARTLRRAMTEAEARLWYHLRDRRLLGFKFVRQFPIASYYADFVCRDAMLVIEADGGQHGSARDAIRDGAIEAAGYTVLRFWNNDILGNTPGVLERIHDTLASCAPSPLSGEGQGEGSFVSDQTHE
nr:endonuclease domain-containing protein [Devosia sp.]